MLLGSTQNTAQNAPLNRVSSTEIYLDSLNDQLCSSNPKASITDPLRNTLSAFVEILDVPPAVPNGFLFLQKVHRRFAHHLCSTFIRWNPA